MYKLGHICNIGNFGQIGNICNIRNFSQIGNICNIGNFYQIFNICKPVNKTTKFLTKFNPPFLTKYYQLPKIPVTNIPTPNFFSVPPSSQGVLRVSM